MKAAAGRPRRLDPDGSWDKERAPARSLSFLCRIGRHRIPAHDRGAPTVLEMRGITKQFPGVLANDDVELRSPSGRGARAPRRERRREVDADEHPVRAVQARRRRDPHRWEAGHASARAKDAIRKRSRHGAPALHAHPGDDRRREHRPRDRANSQGRLPRLRRGSPPGGHRWRSSSGSPSIPTRRSRTSQSASSSALRS